jgi:hypothetical protein
LLDDFLCHTSGLLCPSFVHLCTLLCSCLCICSSTYATCVPSYCGILSGFLLLPWMAYMDMFPPPRISFLMVSAVCKLICLPLSWTSYCIPCSMQCNTTVCLSPAYISSSMCIPTYYLNCTYSSPASCSSYLCLLQHVSLHTMCILPFLPCVYDHVTTFFQTYLCSTSSLVGCDGLLLPSQHY